MLLPNRWHTTPMPVSGSRMDDDLDLAFMELPENLVRRFPKDAVFVKESDFILAIKSIGKKLVIHGYPARMSKGGKTHIFREEEVVGLGIGDSLSGGTNSEVHTLIRANSKVARSSVRGVSCQGGMSGGPVWQVDKNKWFLAGVVTDYMEKENTYRATRIDHLLRMIG